MAGERSKLEPLTFRCLLDSTIADSTTIGLERAVQAGASVVLVKLADVTDAQFRFPKVPLMVRGLPEIDVTFSLLEREMGHPLGTFLLAPYRVGISTYGETLDLNKLIK